MIGYIHSGRFTRTQTDTCMRSVPDAGKSCVQLSMREDRACEVDTYAVECETLAAIESRCICGCQRELFAMESVARMEGSLEGYARNENVF